ncbi:MAG: hypothetical protein K8I30_05860 [Anaerolineae bacterium]|nr:hypothetical protein [Anaerolineae bacterium]
MLLNSDFYDLTQNFQGALFQGGLALQPGGPPPPQTGLIQLRRGYAESPAWMLIQAQEFDPEPLTVENVRVRAVWSSARIIRAILDLMASEQWLDRVGEVYHLTEQGQAVLRSVIERRALILTPLVTYLSADEAKPIERLLRRIVDASLSHTAPPNTWSLAHSRKRTPSDNAPTVLKLFQYCADLNAYRDDSHMAAFQPLGVEAHAWEAFSHVWSGTAYTAGAIYELLPYRGYSRAEYEAGLRDIAGRGWLQTNESAIFTVTDEGRKVRDEAERLTDQYFYDAWSCLTGAEIEELHQRMSDLKAKLESIGK